MHNAESEYQSREKKYFKQFNKANKKYNLLSNLRLVLFIGIMLGAVLYYLKHQMPGILIAICSIIIFVIVMVQHEKVKRAQELAFALSRINRQAMDRINGDWVNFNESGEEYIDKNHPYSIDLDIFGRASLFQWINSTFTFLGRQFLQDILLEPGKDVLKIKERQVAINEIALKLDWRQHFVAEGSSIKNVKNDPEWLFRWAEKENRFFRSPWLIWGIRLISFATLFSLLGIFLIDKWFFNITMVLLLTQLFLFFIGIKINSKYGVAVLQQDAISTFQKLLHMIEMEKFQSKYLSELKLSLIDLEGNFASKQIKELAFIVDMMSYQSSPLIAFVLNVFFLLDYHCMIALEKWKMKSGLNLRTWLTVIGKFEELSSLALIRYDNPNWCNPQFTDAKQNISALDMGHPLLASKSRVCNDLDIIGGGHVLLITGSNMSGKSTILRTVGINLVLAYTGAPVCASDFQCSMMDIYTSMRVNDNLEQNISSFYAELLRIKTIIQAVNNSDSVLFLLDEIFKGTNSKDRHTGAAVVIRKLSKMGAVGLVSTHDLELGELESDKNINVGNYHFSESYLNNQIIFDFKLRAGISETTNAIHLMKMLGIDEV